MTVKKFDKIETMPMFDIEHTPPPAPKASTFPGPRTVRLVSCPAGAHRAGLIVGNGHHLVWRAHLVHTAAGSTWWCTAGGHCLCVAPAPTIAGVHTPTCADPTSGEWSW